MNVELLKRLRTRFRRMRHPEHFDMQEWGTKTDCGTQACIAGHTLLLSGYSLRKNYYGYYDYYSPSGRKVNSVASTARKLLGLSIGTTGTPFSYGSRELFFDSTIKTPRDAADRIDEILAGQI